MPSDAEHLAVAEHHRQFIDHLLPDLSRFSDWISVAAFYRALHLIEAVFYCNHPDKHGPNHVIRDEMLQRTKRYRHIYKYYRMLWAASTVARYLEDHSTGTVYATFNAYLSPADVQARILNHYLKQVENAAAKFLPPPSARPTP